MKGQYFSFDAIIGASIFILTLIAIMSYWYGISNSIEQQQSILAKEAMRIADIIYSPQEIPYGLALSWNDKHLNSTRIEEDFCGPTDAGFALGSAYLVSVKFKSVETDGTIDCTWGEEDIVSNSIYRMRRTASLYNEDGTTERAYVDVYVYEPAPDTAP